MSELLRYQTRPRLYRIETDETPFTTVLEGWTISENYVPNTHPDIGAGEYRVVLERSVGSREEIWASNRLVFEIADELDVLWTYVCGRPLFPMLLQLEAVNAPEGWETNKEEVEDALDTSGLTATVRFESRNWLELPIYPLKRALALRGPYREASDTLRSLIELHYSGLKAAHSHARLFFFAKALELVRSLLPGRTVAQKQRALSADVQSELRRSLNWVYDMSNSRYDVRHVVRDSATASLHPRITDAEAADFEHDAELVIRALISDRLGCDLIVLRSRP